MKVSTWFYQYRNLKNLHNTCCLGQWKDNRAHGHGKFIHVDGDVYEGNWVNDKANGFGVYVHVNGARYEGEWKDDL